MARAIAICKCDKCGEEFTVTKTCMNRRDADSWEEWASRNYYECSSCYKERKRKEEAEAIASTSAKCGYPDFEKGSEKQKAWAAKIRYNMLRYVRESVVSGCEFTEQGKEFYKYLKHNTDAVWWIDNRDRELESIFRDWVQATA